MFIWNTGRNVSCDVVDLHCDFFGALDPDPDCDIFKSLIQIVILNLCIRNRLVILKFSLDPQSRMTRNKNTI